MTKLNGETVGQRVYRLRMAKGLSQRQLSGPGISYAYISRIEAGARVPSVKTLRILAPKLGVTVSYLETGEDFDLTTFNPASLSDETVQHLHAVLSDEALARGLVA